MLYVHMHSKNMQMHHVMQETLCIANLPEPFTFQSILQFRDRKCYYVMHEGACITNSIAPCALVGVYLHVHKLATERVN